MFSDGGPRAWKTKKGHSNLERDIEEVINAQAKGDDARNSISKIIEDKRAASIVDQTETV
jgi:ribosomal protein S3AE